MTAAGPACHPPGEDLDDLEVLRHGLYGPDATMRPLPVPKDVADAALESGSLVVVDAEGVPVARVEDLAPAGPDHLVGRPTWLGTSSERPFQRLHLTGPVDLSGRDVVLARRPEDLPEAVPPHALVLTLASTALDGPTAGTATVRAALRGVGGDEQRVAVVPVPPGDAERELALLATLGVDPARLPSVVDPGPPPGEAHAPGAPRSVPEKGPAPGVVVLLTGLSGSGKSTLARALATRLAEEGAPVTLLDGDAVRRHLTAGLGFSAADRRTNVLRIGWVAAEVAHHGGLAVCCPIAPEDAVRREVARRVADRGGRFVLVHVATPLEECERRDRKGLYAAARRGEIPDFTGVSAPYDVPADPDLRIDTTGRDADECAAVVLAAVHRARGREVSGA